MKKLIVIPVVCILGLTALTLPVHAGNFNTASLTGDPWTRIDGAAPIRKPSTDFDTIVGE